MYEHVKTGGKYIPPSEQPLHFQSGYFLNKPRTFCIVTHCLCSFLPLSCGFRATSNCVLHTAVLKFARHSTMCLYLKHCCDTGYETFVVPLFLWCLNSVVRSNNYSRIPCTDGNSCVSLKRAKQRRVKVSI